MAAYEAIFILKPDLGDELNAKTLEKVSALIPANGGTVTAFEKAGNRRLAYEVKGYSDGYYAFVKYEGQPAATRELERFFKITDEVIRYLIVRDEAANRPAPAGKEAQPAVEEPAQPATEEAGQEAPEAGERPPSEPS